MGALVQPLERFNTVHRANIVTGYFTFHNLLGPVGIHFFFPPRLAAL